MTLRTHVRFCFADVPGTAFSENWDFEEESDAVKKACAKGAYRAGTASKDITYWTITKGEVELIGSGYSRAAHGDYYVDVNGWGTGGIEQVSATQSV
jgi:hypothetical protein